MTEVVNNELQSVSEENEECEICTLMATVARTRQANFENLEDKVINDQSAEYLTDAVYDTVMLTELIEYLKGCDCEDSEEADPGRQSLAYSRIMEMYQESLLVAEIGDGEELVFDLDLN